jgi:phenylalanine ammonia-lyase
MGTEALVGTRGSFDPFIHNVARPHPGQVSKTITDPGKFSSCDCIFAD